MFPRTFLRLLTGLCLLWANATLGATDTTTFTVTASVNDSCTVSATDLGFGNYDPHSGSDLDATSSVTAKCTNGTNYTVGLDAGTGSGATTDNRLMTLSGGTETLSYGLYQDVDRTINWDDVGGTSPVTGTGDGTEQAHTVYGRIAAGQTSAVVGSYSDTITVTISY